LDTQATTTTQDKQITIGVPEDRLAEFYAFYGRFLAVGSRRGDRGRRGRGGHRHGGEGRCRGYADVDREQAAASAPTAAGPPTAASAPTATSAPTPDAGSAG
jgi:hypothetical protein